MARWRIIGSSLIAVVLLLPLPEATPAALAQSEPVFRLPFPCEEPWGAVTYADHWNPDVVSGSGDENVNPVDFNLDGPDKGRNVLAGADRGTVTKVGYDGPSTEHPDHFGCGNYVKVAYPGGVELLLAHLDTIMVSEADLPGSVTSHTQIGTIGDSGLAEAGAYHLHPQPLLQSPDGRRGRRFAQPARIPPAEVVQEPVSRRTCRLASRV